VVGVLGIKREWDYDYDWDYDWDQDFVVIVNGFDSNYDRGCYGGDNGKNSSGGSN